MMIKLLENKYVYINLFLLSTLNVNVWIGVVKVFFSVIKLLQPTIIIHINTKIKKKKINWFNFYLSFSFLKILWEMLLKVYPKYNYN